MPTIGGYRRFKLRQLGEPTKRLVSQSRGGSCTNGYGATECQVVAERQDALHGKTMTRLALTFFRSETRLFRDESSCGSGPDAQQQKLTEATATNRRTGS